MKYSTRILASTLLGCAITAPPAMAFERVAGEVAPKSGGFIGLGVSVAPDYEGSDDYEAFPAPFGHYGWESGRYVDLGGTSGAERAARLEANILTRDWGGVWHFGPVVQYRLKRDDDVEDDKVKRMKEVDAATEAGGFVGFKLDAWSASFTFVGDVSSEHKGGVGYLNGGYELPIDTKLKLSLGAHLTWASDGYMQTYFGVTPGDAARSGLTVQSASSGLKDTGLSLTGHYSFNKTWGLVGNLSYTRMLNDAKDSPLVDSEDSRGDANQFGGLLAVTYSF
jgi:outer membrane protein